MRARSLLTVDWFSSCKVISFSHFLQLCTYSWLPRLCLLRDNHNVTACSHCGKSRWWREQSLRPGALNVF